LQGQLGEEPCFFVLFFFSEEEGGGGGGTCGLTILTRESLN
jgi:hypothetical protein